MGVVMEKIATTVRETKESNPNSNPNLITKDSVSQMTNKIILTMETEVS